MTRSSLIILLAMFLVSCKKNPDPIPVPEKVVLISPASNEACLTGVIISPTKSSVTFTWNAATNANSYEVVVKNLLTGAINSQNSINANLTLVLERNMPYSWYVTSKSNLTTGTSQSDIWKFYNVGTGVINYPPFPAEIIAPLMGQRINAPTGKIKLQWSGADADNDIIAYDIYFGTLSTVPALLMANVVDTFLDNVNISSGTTYYWKVVTKDSKGNTSSTNSYQFTVN